MAKDTTEVVDVMISQRHGKGDAQSASCPLKESGSRCGIHVPQTRQSASTNNDDGPNGLNEPFLWRGRGSKGNLRKK